MHKRVRAIPLPTSTGKLVIGPLPSTTPDVIVWFGAVNSGTGSAVITAQDGTVIDVIAATSSKGPSTHGLTVNGPITVTVTGTLTGSAYIG